MLKKPNLLVVGSFVMDLIATTQRAPGAGENVTGLSFRTAPGGKGANQAVQAARLGAHVTMAGCVGGDSFGRELLDTVSNAGVDVSPVRVDPSTASGVGQILIEQTETGTQNRITYIPGANLTLKPADVAVLKDTIDQYDMVLLQLELREDLTQTVAQYARNAGVPVMLNPAPAAPLSSALVQNVTYLTPNEYEAALITGTSPLIVDNAIDSSALALAADRLRSTHVSRAVITLGRHGHAVITPEEITLRPRVEIPHVEDPTGAGDSFVAAFSTGIAAGLTELQALDLASHASALTVSRIGAMPALPTLAEVRSLMEEHQYRGFDLSLLDHLST